MAQTQWKASFEEKARFANAHYMELHNCILGSALANFGPDGVARLHWSEIRRHQRSFFVPGLKKLGLENEASDAIAAAKFHVLSNVLGGIDVQYVEESPEKVWIRYNPPHFVGSLVAALPSSTMVPDFAGWHAFNGRSLGNPRLGYVLTHLMCQGDPYDAGYFKIYDRDLDPEECLQFSQGERMPPVDPMAQPQLGEDWPPERRLRALRNYGVEFAYELIQAVLDLHGVGGARAIVEHAAAISMGNQKNKLVAALDLQQFDAEGIATFIQRDRALLDEVVEIEKVSSDEYVVRQKARNRRLFPDSAAFPVEIDEALLKGWRTLLELVNRDLTVDMTQALSAGHSHYEWVIHPRAD